MIAIKKARRIIEADPGTPTAQTLAKLVLALETKTSFPLHEMYELDRKRFDLALDILAEWRLDRYYASKLRLMDASAQVLDAPAQEPAPAPSTSA